MQHSSWVQSTGFECLLFGQTAVFNGLRCFLVKVPCLLRVITVYGYVHAYIGHQGYIVWYSILHFGFVRPPVAEGRGGSTTRFHFIGYFITFKDMRKSVYGEME